jgi:YD repeat-containing protein
MSRVIEEKSLSSRFVLYEWGGSGSGFCGSGCDVRLTKIIDPGNNIWEFKYDIMGNAIEMIYPDRSKIKQVFNIAGRLKIFTNKRKQSIQYSYDADTYNDLNAAYQPIRRYVYGAWFYEDGGVDKEKYWWQPTRNGATEPSPPRGGTVAGSLHTHPTFYHDGRKRPHKPESNDDKDFAEHPWHKVKGKQKPLCTVSTGGIWCLLNGEITKIMSYKELKKWCKCHGYWK